MGGRQSLHHDDVVRRPRSSSVMNAGDLQDAPGPARRTASHMASNRPDGLDDDEFVLDAGPSHVYRDRNSIAFWLQHVASGSGGPPERRHRHHTTAVDRRIPLFRFLTGQDVECPVCKKRVPSDDAEVHLVMCFTRPKLGYNEEILNEDRGECCICLEDMNAGDKIARLECLCIFHKNCIDEWFKRKNTCPQHPGDD